MHGKLRAFTKNLEAVDAQYRQAEALLRACPGLALSYNDLKALGADVAALAAQLQSNRQIQALVHKMGRDHMAQERNKRCKIPHISQSEVHGIRRRNDIMRLLPGELANLDDPTLETLFYARLLENNLLCYELRGSAFTDGETSETQQQRAGPVVACLDTSASMQGKPLLRAKALLLATANILKREHRALHVLLFDSNGQLKEYTLDQPENMGGLLYFLQQGFNGGTDFETPLKRACQIIATQKTYHKADILMISDGDCGLSAEFEQHLQQQKQDLDCSVYSMLCAGVRVEDGFSDEVVVL